MQGIDIEEEPDGSLLTVNNLQIEDDGIIECIAVNSVGKAIASTRLLGRIKMVGSGALPGLMLDLGLLTISLWECFFFYF